MREVLPNNLPDVDINSRPYNRLAIVGSGEGIAPFATVRTDQDTTTFSPAISEILTPHIGHSRHGRRLGGRALIAVALLFPSSATSLAADASLHNQQAESSGGSNPESVMMGRVAVAKSSELVVRNNVVAAEQQFVHGLVCNGAKPKVFKNNRTMKQYCRSSVDFMPFWRQCRDGDVPACRAFMRETRQWSRRAEVGAGRAWEVIRPAVRWLRSEAAEFIAPN